MSGARTIGVAVLASAVVLATSYWLFFVRPERAAEKAAPLGPETLVLTAAAGVVEVASGDGPWRAVQAGEKLSAHDRIRTDDLGAAELRSSDGSRVRLYAATDARVDELRRELKRLRLGSGMVEADVHDDSARVFEVGLDDDGAVARTRGGAFTASANGSGTAAVATRRGEVVLSAHGKEVVIRTGQLARIVPGAPPEAPTPVPQSLFLKVQWPPGTSNRRQLTVAGETAPGARVNVAGHYVKVDATGHYRTALELPDGTHELSVEAVDVAGHVVDEKSPRIVVDTTTDFKVQPPHWK
jgi:hypothetical protein